MKEEIKVVLEYYKKRYPFFSEIEEDVRRVRQILAEAFREDGKILLCGNGGSNADADHITGELLKGFKKRRFIKGSVKEHLEQYGQEGGLLANKLQEALPAINLGAHTSLMTAVINDLDGEMVFAQQIMGLGRKQDILFGISTSGNSRNILYAAMAAKAKGMKCIGLTGGTGGRMAGLFDISIRVPAEDTAEIQEMHTAVYHALCEMIENEFWEE